MFLTINITDVEDALTLKNGQLIEAVFTHALEIVCRNFHPQNASVGRVWPGADGVSKSVI